MESLVEEAAPLTEGDITQTIETLLATAWADISPQEINNGQCTDFAEDVVTLLKHAGYDAKWDWIPGLPHAAVAFQGKWFDAECPQGAPAHELPYGKRELKLNGL